MDLQPTLTNALATLHPLKEADFEEVYAAASDPAVWQFHPNKDRWKREVFRTFFNGAMASRGAFRITENRTGTTIGCTRYYDHDAAARSIFIGYTFFRVAYWRKGYNLAVKRSMLDHIFPQVDRVYFHIGAANIPSQRSIVKLGAEKVGEETVAYFGEAPKLNFTYAIGRSEWAANAAH